MNVVGSCVYRRYCSSFKHLTGLRISYATKNNVTIHWQLQKNKLKKSEFVSAICDYHSNVSPLTVYINDPTNVFCSSNFNVAKGLAIQLKPNLIKNGKKCEISCIGRPRYFTSYSKSSLIKSKPTLPVGQGLSSRNFWSNINRRPSALLDNIVYKDIFFIRTFTLKFCTSQTDSHGGTKVFQETAKQTSISEPDYLYFRPSCKAETRASVTSSFIVQSEFLSEDEESTLLKEVEPHLKRLKYEFDHWDDAIHGFRETERSRWGKASSGIIARMRHHAFPSTEKQLPQTHVLDLAKTGVIKPHVDSIRFCGNIICGLCLLSDAVMRLVHVEQKDQVIDILLKRRSLYIMKDESRYKYTHEVLGEKESYFRTEPVPRDRRVSIICRNYPREDVQ